MKHERLTISNGKGEFMVSRQNFKGTNELAKYVRTAKINKIFKNESLSSKKRKESGFNDFNNFEEATIALEYGTDIYYEDFKKNIKKVQDFINKKEKNKTANYKNDKVGFLPIVPKVLQGNPINMINQDVKPKPYPTARIILEKANSACIDAKDMNEFYAIIFVLIQLLENRGIRCEIWVASSFYERPEIVVTKVKLKNYTQPLNIYKIQFPIIASDFFRRICFRMLESNPDIEDGCWYLGYGSPLTTKFDFDHDQKELYEIIGIEENDIYIPSCQYFKYKKGNDLDQTIKRIINETGLKNYIKLTE